MKVLHIVPILKSGGAPINVLRFIKGTSHSLNNILVSKSDCKNITSDAKLSCYKYRDIDVSRISFLSLFQLFKLVLSEKPDIIHTNGKCGLFYGALLNLLFAFSSKKFFHTYRGFYLPNNKIKKYFHIIIESMYSRLVDCTICVSDSELIKVKQMLWGSFNSVVIPNGVAINPGQLPESISAKLDLYELNMVSLSRICFQKDILKMLKSFAKIYRKGMSLHIIGGVMPNDKEYEADVHRLLSTLDCKDHVYLWGDLYNASGLLRHFDIYISTARFEGLPTGIIEAGLCELPVVATPCVGNVDLINDKTGYLACTAVTSDISNAIFSCISEIKSDHQHSLIKELNLLSKRFSVDNNVQKISKLYRK